MDDSFKRPGSIPFKWEIHPGVPRSQPKPTTTRSLPPPPPLKVPLKLSPPPSLKLTPPPSLPPPRPIRSTSAPRSRRRSSPCPSKWKGQQTPQTTKLQLFPHQVSSQGCFFYVPSLARGDDKKGRGSVISTTAPHHTWKSPASPSPFRRSLHARDEMELVTRWIL